MATPDGASIAIVGMSCRLPGGVNSPRGLRDFCEQGLYAWSPIPDERWRRQAFYHPNHLKHGYINARGGAFLESDVKSFDAPFFGISPKEALAMDPQHRQLLECACESFEDAGYPLSSLAGRLMGVFAASCPSDYDTRRTRDLLNAPDYEALGGSSTMFANRLSYHLDLRGPSVSIDTACSSSLTSLHMAVQSLRSGDCDSALVGGSLLHLDPSTFVALSGIGVLGADGRCYAFDERAEGFGRGEGAVCIVLKSLEDAQRSGDSIRAVIRGSRINHNGKTPGIAQPNDVAQAELIKQTYISAGLDVLDTDFVEGHGTGTAVGDPLEATAIAEAFKSDRRENGPLYLGSVKSQFGHLEGTSGLLGVAKCVLMLETKQFFPNGDFQRRNQSIEFGKMNIDVLATLKPWLSDKVRRVSVNNFGFGGSNAHVILEEAIQNTTPRQVNGHAPELSDMSSKLSRVIKSSYGSTKFLTGEVDKPTVPTNATSPQQYRLFPLSSRDGKQLARRVTDLAVHIKEWDVFEETRLLSDLSFTLCEKRDHFQYRFACSAASLEELGQQLDTGPLHGEPAPRSSGGSASVPRVCFIFTGQGSQWHGMGRELIEYEVFSRSIERADVLLKGLGAKWSLRDEVWGNANPPRLNEAAISQPAVTVLQIALVMLLESLGITPQKVIGHSSGEIAAAFAANILDFETAVAVAYYRGIAASRITADTKRGSMLAIGASSLEVDELIHGLDNGAVVIACFNSPTSVTVSGDAEAVEQLHHLANQSGIPNTKLRVGVAYHSPHMLDVAPEYLERLETCCTGGEFSHGNVEFYSTVEGYRTNSPCFGPSYWVKNLTSPVRFDLGLKSLLTSDESTHNHGVDHDFLIEIGPAATLKRPVQEIIKSLQWHRSFESATYNSVLEMKRPATMTLLNLVASLFVQGQNPQLTSLRSHKHREESTPAKALHDLPAYPWARDQQYYFRSSVTDAVDRNDFGWHVLLGRREQFSPESGSTYRNVFTLDDIPFLRDHKIEDNVIYPGAAYVCTAIEACRDTARLHKETVKGYTLREVRMRSALFLKEDTSYELITSFKGWRNSSRADHSNVWYEFSISSIQSEGLREHCSGYASIVFEKTPNPVNGRSMFQESPEKLRQRATSLIEQSTTELTGDQFYKLAKNKTGFEWGPTFQGLRHLRKSPVGSYLELIVKSIAHTMPQGYINNLVIHPGTLDSIVQGLVYSVYVPEKAQVAGLEQFKSVPVFFEEVFISENFPRKALTKLAAITYDSALLPGYRYAVASLYCMREGSYDSTLMHLKGVKFAAVNQDVAPIVTTNIQSAAKLDLEPLIDTFERYQFEDELQIPNPHEEETSAIRRLQAIALQYLERIMDLELDTLPEGYYRKAASWMKGLVRNAEALGQNRQGEVLDKNYSSTGAYHDSKHESISDPAEDLIHRVGSNLESILRGEQDPLAIMMEDGLLGRFYEYTRSNMRGNRFMKRAMVMLGHQNPALKILEVGAGTGGTTLSIMSGLTAEGETPHFAKYDFTDISAGFFESAAKKLERWKGLVEYRQLDISIDPLAQGFLMQDYDVVVAANVLHATSDLTVTLKNVHKLLKPGGKLLLLELTKQAVDIFMPFSVLPGWWAAEDERDYGPAVTSEHWDSLLRRTGFSGIDACVADYSTPEAEFAHCGSFLITTVPSSNSPKPKPTPVFISMESDHESGIEECVSHFKEKHDIDASVKGIENFTPKNADVIILDRRSSDFMTKMTPDRFSFIQKLFYNSRTVLWVIDGSAPNGHFVKGFFRTLRLENPGTKFVTLEVSSLDTESMPLLVAKVFKHAMIDRPGQFDSDVEYVVVHGVINIVRLQPDTDLTNFMKTNMDPDRLEVTPWKNENRPLELRMAAVGRLNTFHFANSEVTLGRVSKAEVEISVDAVALNFRDLLMAMGELPWEGLGLECSGIVTAVGADIQDDFTVGDRVVYWGRGCYASYIHCQPEYLAPLPVEMTPESAASIPVVFATAWICLVDEGQVKPGDQILIHAGSGGVGQAAIIIAQMLGAEIFTTVGSATKRDFLQDKYDIPSDHIFYSRDTTFAPAVMEATGGRGVDVLLNSLSGESLQESWRCMADLGRFIEIGKMNSVANRMLDTLNFLRSVSYIAVDIGTIGRLKPLRLKKAMEEVLQQMKLGALRPVEPITTLPMGAIEEGLRMMQQGKHMGKIVWIADQNTNVQAGYVPESRTLLNPGATYCITGGTGGLGISAARWMINHGARFIILLSRSGATSENAKALIAEAAAKDVVVEAKSCNVADTESMKSALGECLEKMPPIRGVIHGALVLKDAMFENSTYQEWERIVQTRVQGTWNLHNLIESPLDFFVCLASGGGLCGNRGQATYAGTCSFMDAFCKWRTAQGVPACSIDLPALFDVGYLTKRQDQVQLLRDIYAEGLDEKGFHILLEAVVIGKISSSDSNNCQAIIGNLYSKTTVNLPFAQDPRFSYGRRVNMVVGAAGNSKEKEILSVKRLIQAATARDAVFSAIFLGVAEKIASMMMIPLESITKEKPVSAYGLDSLVIVEFRSWLQREVEANIPTLDLLNMGPLENLVVEIMNRSNLVEAEFRMKG